jgi:hypothetical protein
MHYEFTSKVLTEIELTCPKCAWQGNGKKAAKEELFLTDAVEIYCPQCHHYFGFISTTEEENRQ